METMIRITLFLILAQTIVQLAPGDSYEKYLRLLVRWILLALMLSPIMALLSGQTVDVVLGRMLQETTALEQSLGQYRSGEERLDSYETGR